MTGPPSGPPPGRPAQQPYPAPGYPPPSPWIWPQPRNVGYPPPGYGYPQPGYGAVPPGPGQPGHPPPGYGGYPAYGGYPGFAPWKPGIIALRPLTLSDIFNGAVGYVRANPKPTLGLTTVVVLITTILGFIVDMATPSIEADTDPESLDVLTAAIGSLASATASLLATVLLSGMLTVVVARAVLGIRITVGETWQRVRGRIPALFGLVLAEIAASLALIAAVALTVYGVYRAAGGMVATLVGAPLVLLLIAGLAYAWTVLALAPVAIVLERRSLLSSIKRSFDLARNRFWRILGIRALAGVVAALVAGAVSIPFLVVGQVLAFGSGATSPSVTGVAIANVGGAIGQILTTPFLAGVVTLLYIDARIRSEAFDLILLSTPPGSADADSLWLPR